MIEIRHKRSMTGFGGARRLCARYLKKYKSHIAAARVWLIDLVQYGHDCRWIWRETVVFELSPCTDLNLFIQGILRLPPYRHVRSTAAHGRCGVISRHITTRVFTLCSQVVYLACLVYGIHENTGDWSWLRYSILHKLEQWSFAVFVCRCRDDAGNLLVDSFVIEIDARGNCVAMSPLLAVPVKTQWRYRCPTKISAWCALTLTSDLFDTLS